MRTSVIQEQGKAQTEKGVTTRRFSIAGFEGRRVPALVLTPEGAEGARPVVLLGHGAGGHKEEPQMLSIARWLVRREGFAVAIADGPVHGDRKTGEDDQAAYRALARPETYEGMAVDWQRVLDACAELPDVSDQHPAYMGFSMGCVLGITTVASEPRIKCAVLAIGGLLQEGANALRDAATRIDRPVLMINQTEDEIFSRESTFRLYDALSGPKRLFFFPGAHSGVPREAMERVREFLHAQLTDESLAGDAPRGTW
jgi:dienelactone hydrolase